jgi:hypothetical protein
MAVSVSSSSLRLASKLVSETRQHGSYRQHWLTTALGRSCLPICPSSARIIDLQLAGSLSRRNARMTFPSLLASFAMLLALAACATQPKAPPPQSNAQLELKLASGAYRCEQGLRVQVEREMRNRVNHRMKIGWNGNTYQLERDYSYSGLPRFEDATSGLVWIDLPWKSVLLDGKTSKPLASECRPA